MRCLKRGIVVLATLGIAGCVDVSDPDPTGDATSDPSAQPPPVERDDPGDAPPNEAGGAQSNEVGVGPSNEVPHDWEIEALQIDGAWVFYYDPEGHEDALLGGNVRIVDGCLYLGDYIVVWHVDRLDDVRAAIEVVNAGGAPELMVGGGGRRVVQTAEDADGVDVVLPAIIAEHCSAKLLWMGAPE